MRYLSPIDAAFLRMESLRTPMHVGGLMTFKLPEGAPREFLHELLAQMREQPFMPQPFGSRILRKGFSRLAPAWEPAEADLDYHIRHSALPYPGGERQLGVLVARLHSHPMDLTRPLWECHLIEGLENNRFAFYFKAHHAAIDGMGAMRMVKSWLTEDPKDLSGPGPVPERAQAEKAVDGNPVVDALKLAREHARALTELTGSLVRMSRGEASTIQASLQTPRSLFNTRVSQQRRLGTQILDLPRIKAVSAATGATVNDVALAICAGAVRRYLLERNALPDKSLMASVPVGLQRPDGKPGNAVAGFVCPLATQEEDPLKRIQTIQAVTNRAKEDLSAMSSTALEQFTMMGMSPLILGQMTGVLARLPPFFNFVVSNVVASKKPLYLRGARMEAMYPISVLFDGYALNITIVGYLDGVAVGFTGCRDAIPRLQRLAVYTSDALGELEQAVLGAPAEKPKRRRAAR